MQDLPGPAFHAAIDSHRDRLFLRAKADGDQLSCTKPPAFVGRQCRLALKYGRDQFALVLRLFGRFLGPRGRLDGKRPAHGGAESRMGKLAAAARIDARQPRSNVIARQPCGRELCRDADDFQKARRRPAARRRAIPWPPRCRAPQSRRRPGDIVPAGRRGSSRRLAPRRPLARSARRRGFSVRQSSFQSPRDRPLQLAASPTPGPE